MTVESGTENEVTQAVETAMDVLAPTRRFILSPVDNVREDTSKSWKNIKSFIDAWKGWSQH
jgi:hypothetical protein